ncbi:MAG TPA: endo-1,4-beta-xylanase [Bacteroides reticulotermitis]|nr:endo-1,4-beta-xylanase [Bacteroides reticulotermitis]
MKTIKYSLSLGLLLSLASCADDQIVDFKTEKPESIAQYEYLNAYDALKTYVDRSTHPNFKLGAGVAASDFLKGGMIRSVAIANFDEIVAGNAMKYASCVADDGTMDFGTVAKFIEEAKTAGLTVYGHTLCWHSQQNNKYLNSLIADKEIEDDGSVIKNIIVKKDFEDGQHLGGWGGATFDVVSESSDGSKCWKITNESEAAFYAKQSALDMPFEAGKVHHLSFKIKGTVNGTLRAGFQNPDNYSSCGDYPDISVSTEWQEVKTEVLVTEGAKRFLLSYGDYVGSILIDDIEIYLEESGATVAIPVPVLEDDFSGAAEMIGWGNNSTRTINNGVMELMNPSQVNPWEAQAGYDFSSALEEGTVYFMKMKIKGSVAGSIGAALQKPEGYAGRGDFPSISVTTDWKEIVVSTTCSGDAATRILLNYGAYAGTLYIDDFSVYWEKSANSIPLTPEEKKEVLTEAMNTWVEGMMKATAGYVTAWDVVNEAISGGGNDGGFYVLQSATNVSAEDAKNNFYWQDYLGNEDYMRIVVAAARKYYAENGGTNPLKLFVNDYNLESDWDDNKKAKSMIHWIEKWEADGVTKIDGIGTQMHVSCYANADTQKSKEEHVVKMFEILANSGKLVKISELDMGYVDEEGNSVKTEKMTEAQHKAMSDYYKFIVKKYFEIIPAAQQYGITQWCIEDSPADSGWRGGEPVGLWDANYNRKHTYAGFADGLAGK